MKAIITMVGTSLFENYMDMDKKPSKIYREYDHLKNIGYELWDDDYVKNCRQQIKNSVLPWANENDDAAAEISSLKKFKERLGEDIDVYLLASDTVLSVLAANIIAEYFIENEEVQDVHFNEQIDVIKGLQIKNKDIFIRKGMVSLVDRVTQIIEERHNNVFLNITGGYKATIPYLTILGQVYRVPMFYNFEKEHQLIEIPFTPLTIDWQFFETNMKLFKLIDNGIENWKDFHQKYYSFIWQAGSLIEHEGNMAMLSPLGKIYWNKFLEKYYFFYATDEVIRKLEQYQDLRSIIIDKMANGNIREAGTEFKGIVNNEKHKVYDDGNNSYRVFYTFKHNDLIIYKVFGNNYDEYDKFWRRQPFNQQYLNSLDFELYRINKETGEIKNV